MSKSTIEWLQRPGTLPEVWNLVTGCNKVSQGCKNCYAEVMHRRLQHMYPAKYNHTFLSGAHMHNELINLPTTWKKPRTVFVNSMSDLFQDEVPALFLAKAFDVMASLPQHTFIILTKRPGNAVEFFGWLSRRNNEVYCKVISATNIIIGVSAEDQATANERIPLLLQLPIKTKMLSAEPLLGPINIAQFLAPQFYQYVPVHEHNGEGFTLPPLNWVVAGGESGHGARPMHPAWVRGLRNQCALANVPFFFKQWGGWEVSPYQINTNDLPLAKNETLVTNMHGATVRMTKTTKKHSGRALDGQLHNAWPQL